MINWESFRTLRVIYLRDRLLLLLRGGDLAQFALDLLPVKTRGLVWREGKVGGEGGVGGESEVLRNIHN